MGHEKGWCLLYIDLVVIIGAWFDIGYQLGCMLLLVPPLRRGYSVVIDFGRVVLLKDLKMLETNKRSSCLLLLLESASTIGNS